MKKTKYILLLIIGIIVGGTIGIKASTLIQSSQVIYKDDKTVEGTLDDLFQELAVGKEKVAEAITNRGVSTESTDTLEVMAANISSITTAPTLIGSGRSYRNTVKFDCTSVDGYENLTTDNFILSITSISASAGNTRYAGYYNASCNPKMTYDATTGILTVSAYSYSLTSSDDLGNPYGEVYTNFNVYLVK